MIVLIETPERRNMKLQLGVETDQIIYTLNSTSKGDIEPYFIISN